MEETVSWTKQTDVDLQEQTTSLVKLLYGENSTGKLSDLPLAPSSKHWSIITETGLVFFRFPTFSWTFPPAAIQLNVSKTGELLSKERGNAVLNTKLKSRDGTHKSPFKDDRSRRPQCEFEPRRETADSGEGVTCSGEWNRKGVDAICPSSTRTVTMANTVVTNNNKEKKKKKKTPTRYSIHKYWKQHRVVNFQLMLTKHEKNKTNNGDSIWCRTPPIVQFFQGSLPKSRCKHAQQLGRDTEEVHLVYCYILFLIHLWWRLQSQTCQVQTKQFIKLQWESVE